MDVVVSPTVLFCFSGYGFRQLPRGENTNFGRHYIIWLLLSPSFILCLVIRRNFHRARIFMGFLLPLPLVLLRSFASKLACLEMSHDKARLTPFQRTWAVSYWLFACSLRWNDSGGGKLSNSLHNGFLGASKETFPAAKNAHLPPACACNETQPLEGWSFV
jgi:hypothetical protein